MSPEIAHRTPCTVESKGKDSAAKQGRMLDSEESKFLCSDYQTGHSQRGAQCRFQHPCEWCEANHPGYRCISSQSHSRESRMSYSRGGKGDTIELKYCKPCISHCDSRYRSKSFARPSPLPESRRTETLDTHLEWAHPQLQWQK